VADFVSACTSTGIYLCLKKLSWFDLCVRP